MTFHNLFGLETLIGCSFPNALFCAAGHNNTSTEESIEEWTHATKYCPHNKVPHGSTQLSTLRIKKCPHGKTQVNTVRITRGRMETHN